MSDKHSYRTEPAKTLYRSFILFCGPSCRRRKH